MSCHQTTLGHPGGAFESHFFLKVQEIIRVSSFFFGMRGCRGKPGNGNFVLSKDPVISLSRWFQLQDFQETDQFSWKGDIWVHLPRQANTKCFLQQAPQLPDAQCSLLTVVPTTRQGPLWPETEGSSCNIRCCYTPNRLINKWFSASEFDFFQ